MITCVKCGKRFPSGLRYCGYCGAPAPAWPARLLRAYDWRFLGLWCLVLAVTCALAWLILTHPLVAGLQSARWYPLLAVVTAGVLMAIAQWLVMRTRPGRGRGTAWWILALPLGWGLAFALYNFWPRMGENVPAVPALLSGLLPLAMLACAAAAMQWPLARHYAWPAAGWILAAMGAVGLTVLIGALTDPAARGGWFTALALRLPAKPGITDYDLGMAALLGALLGVAQFLPVRRAAPAAVVWPIVLAGTLALAALFLDAGLVAASGIIQAATGMEAVAAEATLSAVGGALAWALMGLAIGGGQWIVLKTAQTWVPRLTPSAQAGPLPEGADGRWVPVATGGYFLAWPVAWLLLPWGWLLLGGATAGLLAGTPQWLALRGHFTLAPWLPAGAAISWCLLVVLTQLPGAPVLVGPLGLVILISALSLAPGLLLARR